MYIFKFVCRAMCGLICAYNLCKALRKQVQGDTQSGILDCLIALYFLSLLKF